MRSRFESWRRSDRLAEVYVGGDHLSLEASHVVTCRVCASASAFGRELATFVFDGQVDDRGRLRVAVRRRPSAIEQGLDAVPQRARSHGQQEGVGDIEEDLGIRDEAELIRPLHDQILRADAAREQFPFRLDERLIVEPGVVRTETKARLFRRGILVSLERPHQSGGHAPCRFEEGQIVLVDLDAESQFIHTVLAPFDERPEIAGAHGSGEVVLHVHRHAVEAELVGDLLEGLRGNGDSAVSRNPLIGHENATCQTPAFLHHTQILSPGKDAGRASTHVGGTATRVYGLARAASLG